MPAPTSESRAHCTSSMRPSSAGLPDVQGSQGLESTVMGENTYGNHMSAIYHQIVVFLKSSALID